MSTDHTTGSFDPGQQSRIAGYLAETERARIDLTEISPEVKVSTMWIRGHARRYIETMILGGNLAGYTVERRYADADDAQAGHNAVVAALRDGIVPDGLTR